MSSIDRLPPEILSMIFVDAISFPQLRQAHVSILSLSKVCSTWRHIAFTFSSLWNHMDYVFQEFEFRSPPNHFRTYFAMWYGRANPYYPLTLALTVSLFHGSDAEGNDTADEFLRGITPFLPRLGKLSITFTHPNFNLLKPFFSLPGSCLPLLEVFTLTDCTDDWSGGRSYHEHDLTLAALSTAPQLRSAYLSLKSPRFLHEPRFALPWSRLEHLYIDEFITPATVSHILPQCTHLRSLCIFQIVLPRSYDPSSISIVPRTPVLFPYLVVLKVTYRELDGVNILRSTMYDLAPFFSMLRFPAVETVQLVGDHYSLLFPLHAVLPGLQNARGRLRQLKLACFKADHVERLVSFVVGCKVLEELVICDVTDASLEILQGLGAAVGNCHDSSKPGAGVVPVLSHLTSFTFVCQPKPDNGGDPAAIRTAFYYFVSCLTPQMQNSDTNLNHGVRPRRRPLKYLALLATDAGVGFTITKETGVELKRLKDMEGIRRLEAGEGGVEVEAGYIYFNNLFWRLGQETLEEFPLSERRFEGECPGGAIW